MTQTKDVTRLQGVPQTFDELMRPFARILQVLLGSLLTFAAWYWAPWWTWPLPLALSFFAYEWFFWRRGDRMITLDLGAEIIVTDPIQSHEWRVRPAGVSAATILYKQAGPQRWHAWIVLSGPEAPVFAARVELEGAVDWLPTDVCIDAVAPVLGGNPAALRAMAPASAVCRQLIRDPKGIGLRWFRENIPTEAWRRTYVRTWQGAAPDLDIVGLHLGKPTGSLQLDGDRVTLCSDAGRVDVEIDCGQASVSSRAIALMKFPGDNRPDGEQELPLLLWQLAPSLTLCIPAPLFATEEETPEPSAQTHHTHLAEGAAALWHILNHVRPGHIPTLLLHALMDARVAFDPLPACFERHLDSHERSSAD